MPEELETDGLGKKRGHGKIVVEIEGNLAERIRELAQRAQATSAASWCKEIMESFVVTQRSGRRYAAPPEHYTASHEWDAIA